MALDTFNPYLFVSAGEQSNKFLTPTYADGIAKFQAQRAQPLTGLTVRMDPIQEGSGDPSPDNIRPISGRTGMTVNVSGSNLLNIRPQSGTVSGVSYVVDNEGYVTLNGTAGAACNIFLAANIAPFNSQVTLSSDQAIPQGMYTGLVQQNGNIGLLELRPGDTTKTSGESGIAEKSRYRIYIVTGASFTDFKYRLMLNFGANALPYAPYNGAAYPISWQTEAGTIYGGTLDVVSGVLTVTHAAVDMGTLTWVYDSRQNRFYTTGLASVIKKGDSGWITELFCSIYKPSAVNVGDYVIGSYASLGYVYTRDTRYSDATEYKTALSGQTLVYSLATPQTYQLTPTQVQTIAGYNQVYSDAGPVIDIKF